MLLRFAFVTILGLSALLIGGRPAFAEEYVSPWGACPPYYDIGVGNPPDCPPPERVMWTDCPRVWPRDGSTPFYTWSLYDKYRYFNLDLWRRVLDANPEGMQLDCEYGPEDPKLRHHLIVDVPGPVIQCGRHPSADGIVGGCSSPKPEVLPPPPVLYFPEPVTEEITLAGIGLGWTIEEADAVAQKEGYSVISWLDEPRVGFYRPNTAVEVVFDLATRRSQEVIVRAGWQMSEIEELNRQTARRFGFGWQEYPLHEIGRIGGAYKEVWLSADRRIAVELWHERRPAESSSLHLRYWAE